MLIPSGILYVLIIQPLRESLGVCDANICDIGYSFFIDFVVLILGILICSLFFLGISHTGIAMFWVILLIYLPPLEIIFYIKKII